MADAPDLGSGAARRGGSSPPSRILNSVTVRGARKDCERPVCAYASFIFGDQFDATVLRASFGSIVGRHEVGLAVAVRMYAQASLMPFFWPGNARQRRRAVGTDLKLYSTPPIASQYPFTSILNVGIGFQSARGLVQDGRIARTDVRFVEIKMHAAQHQLLLHYWRRR